MRSMARDVRTVRATRSQKSFDSDLGIPIVLG
jgi:hypothetical protein